MENYNGRRPSAAGTRPVMDVLGPAVDTSDPTKTEIGPDRVTVNITNRNNANISLFVMDGIAATAVRCTRRNQLPESLVIPLSDRNVPTEIPLSHGV